MKLIVVGYPRGGTSFMAEYLKAIGLKTVVDTRTHPDYPSGYGEHFPILLFNKMCERLRGSRNRITEDELISESFLEDDFIKTAFETAYQPMYDPDIDFIKVPALALSLNFISEKFRESHVLAVFRSPHTAMDSFYRREFGRWHALRDIMLTIACWNMYALRILQFHQDFPETLDVVDVDAIIEYSSPELTRILLTKGFHVESIKAKTILRKKWKTDKPLFWRAWVFIANSFAFLAPNGLSKYFKTYENYRKLQEISLNKGVQFED